MILVEKLITWLLMSSDWLYECQYNFFGTISVDTKSGVIDQTIHSLSFTECQFAISLITSRTFKNKEFSNENLQIKLNFVFFYRDVFIQGKKKYFAPVDRT